MKDTARRAVLFVPERVMGYEEGSAESACCVFWEGVACMRLLGFARDLVRADVHHVHYLNYVDDLEYPDIYADKVPMWKKHPNCCMHYCAPCLLCARFCGCMPAAETPMQALHALPERELLRATML